MSVSFDDKLVVAISSRALFDMAESHEIYITQGIDAYYQYQLEHEDEILKPGVAFDLVKKFLSLNDISPDDGTKVEVILLSRNSADTGLRVFKSIEEHNLNIVRAAFTNGKSPYRYVSSFGAHLFLSADPDDVKSALQAGIAAATILPSSSGGVDSSSNHPELKIAFDGDAVLFSDEAERIYQLDGLETFNKVEKNRADKPLPGGPFKNFLAALQKIQSEYPTDSSPLRTALVTARGAPAHERVIKTLRAWDIRIDEALFLGGLDKATFLDSFEADIFFDDNTSNCASASGLVTTGHVPNGISNE
ncbi:MAG: 5'-nucleotidase [Gammaproteobacteria bacterium]|nr:MAG: 5'-nucleotidase [Gammaproteobacteria bacterium]